jgi:3-dehydroquinate synthase
MKTRRVPVRLGDESYDVLIDRAAAPLMARWLVRDKRVWVGVTDARVQKHVWSGLARRLRALRIEVPEPIVIAEGEPAKTLSTWMRLQSQLLRRGLDRTSLVVAVGGGVVTDVTGFAAATYLRGIDWLAVPTTLLGMVDASVGGKVGANLLRTKNAVGAFHQPRGVLIGTDALATLAVRERRSGLGEVVKYAMIADRALFRQLERGAADRMGRDPAADARLVARCCRIKACFVEQDAREHGSRAALNFGHTLGHALEGDGRHGLTHGEAVGLGMLADCALAEDLGVAREPQLERLRNLLHRLALPVRAPRRPALSRLRQAWRRDKKARRGRVRFVLTPRIGEVSIGHAVDDRRIAAALETVLP